MIFRKNWWGLPISLVGLGLSVQFEFFLVYLVAIFILLFIVFRQRVIPLLSVERVATTTFFFVLSISTFVVADILFRFRTLTSLVSMTGGVGKSLSEFGLVTSTYVEWLARNVNDNLVAFNPNLVIGVLVFLAGFVLFWILNYL